ncbi:hypothetical protein FDECE_13688 [Fusarium decemcellulare]|nr:hypothetical protein FDECE_13688 [Fusarium decemcellulare]
MPSLINLSPELQLHITSYLRSQDLISAAQTCKALSPAFMEAALKGLSIDEALRIIRWTAWNPSNTHRSWHLYTARAWDVINKHPVDEISLNSAMPLLCTHEHDGEKVVYTIGYVTNKDLVGETTPKTVIHPSWTCEHGGGEIDYTIENVLHVAMVDACLRDNLEAVESMLHQSAIQLDYEFDCGCGMFQLVLEQQSSRLIGLMLGRHAEHLFSAIDQEEEDIDHVQEIHSNILEHIDTFMRRTIDQGEGSSRVEFIKDLVDGFVPPVIRLSEQNLQREAMDIVAYTTNIVRRWLCYALKSTEIEIAEFLSNYTLELTTIRDEDHAIWCEAYTFHECLSFLERHQKDPRILSFIYDYNERMAKRVSVPPEKRIDGGDDDT